ncbi:unnamed protein product [Bursaphelenchus xylophilus]|nr:unnamed protein product [Bursaphelenchus xylophilus]CAG9096744.1 unnamed protein product [Bursaphelenchus xylophilus]
MISPDVADNFTKQELDWIHKFTVQTGLAICGNRSGYINEYNVLRWCHAYPDDFELALRKFRRHLNIRKILFLDNMKDDDKNVMDYAMDELADHYAPLHYIGTAGPGDHRPVFLEQSGKFDIQSMMSQIRITAFMMNRFRLMERILHRIREAEDRTDKPSSAILLLDLQGLKFHPNLVQFLTGTFRIMWGTLMEQYPFMFSKFILINAPTFMNIIWSACSGFIPAEYKNKIHVLNTSNDYSALHEHIAVTHLPKEYQGHTDVHIPLPIKCLIEPIPHPEVLLSPISIPAGGVIIETFYLTQSQKLEFFLKHSKGFTMNIFFHPNKKVIEDHKSEVDEMLEVFAGCERPPLPTLDSWPWKIPYTGFYHVIYGNEKAWFMSVSLEYQIFEVHANGNKVKVNPIKV